MPQDLHTAEVAAIYGAIDSDALEDGDAANAAVLRELGRSANRLRNRGGFLFRMSGDYDDASQLGIIRGVLTFPEWSRVGYAQQSAPKNPYTRTATARIKVELASGATAYFQLCTRAATFNPNAWRTAANVRTIVGTGGISTYEMTGLALREGEEHETLDVFVRGDPTGSAIDTGVFGTASGSVTDILESSAHELEEIRTFGLLQSGSFIDSGASFNVANFNAHADSTRIMVTFFLPGTTTPIAAPRRIIGADSTTRLRTATAFSMVEKFMLIGADYELTELSTYRLIDLCVYGDDI